MPDTSFLRTQYSKRLDFTTEEYAARRLMKVFGLRGKAKFNDARSRLNRHLEPEERTESIWDVASKIFWTHVTRENSLLTYSEPVVVSHKTIADALEELRRVYNLDISSKPLLFVRVKDNVIAMLPVVKYEALNTFTAPYSVWPFLPNLEVVTQDLETFIKWLGPYDALLEELLQ